MNILTAEQIIGALHKGREDAMRRSGVLSKKHHTSRSQKPDPEISPRILHWAKKQLLPGDNEAIERYISARKN